jgi:hypothetical protein
MLTRDPVDAVRMRARAPRTVKMGTLELGGDARSSSSMMLAPTIV